MTREYNSQAFTPEQVSNGELQDLLNYLMNFNVKSDKAYMDIHITSDGYCQIVEWVEIMYEFREECGKFDFIGANETIYEEVSFPDEHWEWYPKGEGQAALEEWLRDHPQWKRNQWGVWYDEDEQARCMKELFPKETKSEESADENKQEQYVDDYPSVMSHLAED